MTTPITSIASVARRIWDARAVSAALLVTGALAAGCGTAVSANANDPIASASSPAASGHGSASAAGSAAPAAPSASASPVPTVTGGPAIVIGQPSCAGWPADADRGPLTSGFTPVSVERCVTSFQQIAGKGEWETATLERSTDHLAELASALMRPSSGRQPGVMCPEFVVLPPQIVLFDSAGQKLIPRIPVGVCGGISTLVMSTLASMTWQPISVRLVAKVGSTVAPKTFPGASLGPGSPKVYQTGAATGVMNGTPVH
jgi:hypothetical protein